MNRLLFCTLALIASATLTGISRGDTEMTIQTKVSAERQAHPYVGMWVTADRRVRHNLLPDGRYDEARGNRESAYQGRYEVRGNQIFYWDDSGFTADGTFINDVLHHGGMVLYRSN